MACSSHSKTPTGQTDIHDDTNTSTIQYRKTRSATKLIEPRQPNVQERFPGGGGARRRPDPNLPRKQVLCVRDARHFRHFLVVRGPSSKAFVFVDRMPIRYFCRFRQNPLFSVGGKDPVWQKPRSCLPDLWHFSSS